MYLTSTHDTYARHGAEEDVRGPKEAANIKAMEGGKEGGRGDRRRTHSTKEWKGEENKAQEQNVRAERDRELDLHPSFLCGVMVQAHSDFGRSESQHQQILPHVSSLHSVELCAALRLQQCVRASSVLGNDEPQRLTCAFLSLCVWCSGLSNQLLPQYPVRFGFGGRSPVAGGTSRLQRSVVWCGVVCGVCVFEY